MGRGFLTSGSGVRGRRSRPAHGWAIAGALCLLGHPVSSPAAEADVFFQAFSEGFQEVGEIPGGFLARVYRAYRYDPGWGANVFYPDFDWNFILRPPECDQADPKTKKFLGRNCIDEKKKFVDMVWTRQSVEWKTRVPDILYQAVVAGCAIDTELAKQPGKKGAAWYKNLLNDIRAKYQAYTAITVADGKKVAAWAAAWTAFQSAALNSGDAIKDLWATAISSKEMFKCFYDRTSGTHNVLLVGEVQLGQGPVAGEGDLTFVDCAGEDHGAENVSSLCGRDVLIHGLYVRDMNHGDGKPEIHPIHAITTKEGLSDNYKFRVLADSGKAAGGGGASIGGYIDDYHYSNPQTWFEINIDSLPVPAKPDAKDDAFNILEYIRRCDWTHRSHEWKKLGFALTPEPTGPGAGKCTFGVKAMPNVITADTKDYWTHWKPGWVVGTMTQEWFQSPVKISKKLVSVTDLGILQGPLPEFATTPPIVRPADNPFEHFTKKNGFIPGRYFRIDTTTTITWIPKKDGNDWISPGFARVLPGVKETLFDLQPEKGFIRSDGRSWVLVAPEKKLAGGYGNRYDFPMASIALNTAVSVPVSLPRPTVNIKKTAQIWEVVKGKKTSGWACAAAGIGKGDQIAYRNHFNATTTRLGVASFEWRLSGDGGEQKLSQTKANLEFAPPPKLNQSSLKLSVVARDGVKGGPFESAKAKTNVKIPGAYVVSTTKIGLKKSAKIIGGNAFCALSKGKKLCGKPGVATLKVAVVPAFDVTVDLRIRGNSYVDKAGKPLGTSGFCPKFTWHNVETRVLPDGKWEAVPMKKSGGPAASARFVVTSSKAQNDTVRFESSDVKPRAFRALVWGVDAVGRSAWTRIVSPNLVVKTETVSTSLVETFAPVPTTIKPMVLLGGPSGVAPIKPTTLSGAILGAKVSPKPSAAGQAGNMRLRRAMQVIKDALAH